MNQKTSGVILTAAMSDITICEVFGYLPTGLIPVNGKPIIFFILEQFYKNGVKDIYIGVDYKKEQLEQIVDVYFSEKLNIKYINTDKNKSAGNSLLNIMKNIQDGKVIVNLGDTYIKKLDFQGLDDSIIVSKDFLEEEKWATVELNDTVLTFKHRKKVQSENVFVVCGLYSFSNIDLLREIKSINQDIQITEILEFYNNKISLKTIETNDWLDFGHIDKYYISKKRLIQSREFNSLEYNDLLGTITKRSENKEKFRYEIKWQINLPKNLKVLAPRVLDYNINESPFITMEYYSYPTLSEIWIFSELNEKIYYSIIDRLFKILELFKSHKAEVSLKDYKSIYIEKTLSRISEIANSEILQLFEFEQLNINGKQYNNWDIIKNDIFDKVEELYYENDNCFIHGDFCLSNILYDLRSGIVRLIDPRGIWGNDENGDVKYDIAKLRHSICGDYDYIVSDLFEINIQHNEISYSTFNSNKINIKKYFDKKLRFSFELKQIKLIEGLLFMSMLALHTDSPMRQKIMYAKSIELLNNVLNEE